MIGKLPDTWAATKLSDVCQINPRGKSGLAEDDYVSFVPMAAVSEFSGTIVDAESRPLREVQKGFTPFQEGDVLFAKITPCMENGKAAIARNLVNQRGYGSTEFHVLRPTSLILAEWIFAIVRTAEFRRAAASSFQGAVGQQRVPASFLEGFRIPLPPLSEQQRIVEILQEAEAVRGLRAEAESKTAELIPAMFFDTFIRDQDHAYQPLHKLAKIVSGVAIGRKQKGMSVEVPYLRVANVQAGYVDLGEVKTTPATDDEILQFALKRGDVLLTEGGDFDKLGRGCLWDGQVEPCIHQNHVFRVRPDVGKMNSQFFAHYLQSAKAKHYFLRCAKKTTNLASINLTQLKALPVPNISIEAQEAFELLIQLAAECSSATGDKAFSALYQSLSAHAFSGQLTADWRETRADAQTTEAHERDAALRQAGTTLTRSRRAATQDDEGTNGQLADGILADLNREQCGLLLHIFENVGGARHLRYFTAESLGRSLRGPLRRNPRTIEGHLAVFAVRGLVIPVSREEQTQDTGEFVFGNAYRLALRNLSELLTEEAGNRLTSESDDALDADAVISDHARGRELERLVAKIEKERGLP